MLNSIFEKILNYFFIIKLEMVEVIIMINIAKKCREIRIISYIIEENFNYYFPISTWSLLMLVNPCQIIESLLLDVKAISYEMVLFMLTQ